MKRPATSDVEPEDSNEHRWRDQGHPNEHRWRDAGQSRKEKCPMIAFLITSSFPHHARVAGSPPDLFIMGHGRVPDLFHRIDHIIISIDILPAAIQAQAPFIVAGSQPQQWLAVRSYTSEKVQRGRQFPWQLLVHRRVA